MDVLGFRFYNFKTKEMEDVVALDFAPSSHVIVCTISGNWEYREDIRVDGVLLQNTGLKDREGNFVFEGDLLEMKYITSRAAQIIHVPEEVQFQAVTKQIIIRPRNWIERKIVGNIYQNPELMEK